MTCPLVKSALILEPGLGPPEDRHPSRRRSPLLLFHISLLESPGVGAATHGAQPRLRYPRRPPPRLGSE